MSVEIKKDITTVQVEVPKTNVAVENAVTNINVQTSQPQLTISQAGVSGKDGTSGTSGVSGTSGNSFIGVLPNYSTAPSPQSGSLYFNTTDSHFYGWNGSEWKQLDN